MPYGRHEIDDDIAAVVAVRRSDWLTSGPMVEQFEGAFAAYVGASHAVAVSNGTAALPMWHGMTDVQHDRVVNAITQHIEQPV